MRISYYALLFFWISIFSAARAEDRSLYDILGSTHWEGSYRFNGSKPFEIEGADIIESLGVTVIKVPFFTKTPGQSLVDLARNKPFQELFARPFKTFILVTYSTVDQGDFGYWRDALSPQQEQREEKEFYELAAFLLKQYAHSHKTFILQNWESDWQVRGHFDASKPPTEAAMQRFISWMKARQNGVARARKETVHEGVSLLNAAEVNLVVGSLDGKLASITTDALPSILPDLASYSNWETHANPAQLRSALDFIQSKISSQPFPRKVYVGEFGAAETNSGPAYVRRVIEDSFSTSLAWGAPYIVWWQTYCNHPKVRPPKKNQDVDGYHLVQVEGAPGVAWRDLRERLIVNDPERKDFLQLKKKLKLGYEADLGGTVPLAQRPEWKLDFTKGKSMSAEITEGKLQIAQNLAQEGYPYAMASLDLKHPLVLKRGITVGEAIEFRLRRVNGGLAGFQVFGFNHGTGYNLLSAPLEIWHGESWKPASFRKWNWTEGRRIALSLDTADGTFASVSFYVDDAYAGSWLYLTSAKTLDELGVVGQSKVPGDTFTFDNFQIFTK